MESSLELFLLALIDSGVNTPYEFHSQAGISVGSSLPALENLLRRKLVSRGKAGNRRRMEYGLTAIGRAALKNWHATYISEQDSEDVGSALRFSTLAYFLGSPIQAIRILDQASALYSESAEPPTKLDLGSPAAAYKWLQSVRERHRHDAEIRALDEIRKKMKRNSG
jgi:DNA-binding PadR family transcriptional regulator